MDVDEVADDSGDNVKKAAKRRLAFRLAQRTVKSYRRVRGKSASSTRGTLTELEDPEVEEDAANRDCEADMLEEYDDGFVETAGASGGKGQTQPWSVDWDADNERGSSAKRPALDLADEVQEELASMSGTDMDMRYIQRPRLDVVDSTRESPKNSKPVPDINRVSDVLPLLTKPAKTAEEKLLVLEARDKLIRIKGKQKKKDKLGNIGTCPDMCPEKERYERIARHQVDYYEYHKDTKDVNIACMVKKYARSSADQQMPLHHDLRPGRVLWMTMSYLVNQFMDLVEQPGENLGEWYHFLWDRTRSVRKDIVQLELCDQKSVMILEMCARFHIFCMERLREEKMAVFDEKINRENLTKCLQSLQYMYNDLKLKNEYCPNEPEFQAYSILLHINSDLCTSTILGLSAEMLTNQKVQFAISIYLSVSSRNYVRFFKLVKSTTYLNACILHQYFAQVRAHAMRSIICAYSRQKMRNTYPASELQDQLLFDSLDDVFEFCRFSNVPVIEDSIVLDKKVLKPIPMQEKMKRSYAGVECKRKTSVKEIVAGGAVPEDSSLLHRIHDSFNEDDILKPESWYAEDQHGHIEQEALMEGEEEDSEPEVSPWAQCSNLEAKEDQVPDDQLAVNSKCFADVTSTLNVDVGTESIHSGLISPYTKLPTDSPKFTFTSPMQLWPLASDPSALSSAGASEEVKPAAAGHGHKSPEIVSPWSMAWKEAPAATTAECTVISQGQATCAPSLMPHNTLPVQSVHPVSDSAVLHPPLKANHQRWAPVLSPNNQEALGSNSAHNTVMSPTHKASNSFFFASFSTQSNESSLVAPVPTSVGLPTVPVLFQPLPSPPASKATSSSVVSTAASPIADVPLVQTTSALTPDTDRMYHVKSQNEQDAHANIVRKVDKNIQLSRGSLSQPAEETSSEYVNVSEVFTDISDASEVSLASDDSMGEEFVSSVASSTSHSVEEDLEEVRRSNRELLSRVLHQWRLLTYRSKLKKRIQSHYQSRHSGSEHSLNLSIPPGCMVIDHRTQLNYKLHAEEIGQWTTAEITNRPPIRKVKLETVLKDCLSVKVDADVFWKLVVSIPDEAEAGPKFSNRLLYWVDNTFTDERDTPGTQRSPGLLRVATCMIGALECLSTSVQRFAGRMGEATQLRGVNGVLFFTPRSVQNVAACYSRYQQIAHTQPLPMVIVLGSAEWMPICCEWLHIPNGQMETVGCKLLGPFPKWQEFTVQELQENIKWLVSHKKPYSPLVGYSLNEVFLSFMGELWCRVQFSLASRNSSGLLQHPEDLLSLYHDALKHLYNMIANDRIDKYVDLSPEFEEILKQEINLHKKHVFTSMLREWMEEDYIKKLHEALLKAHICVSCPSTQHLTVNSFYEALCKSNPALQRHLSHFLCQWRFTADNVDWLFVIKMITDIHLKYILDTFDLHNLVIVFLKDVVMKFRTEPWYRVWLKDGLKDDLSERSSRAQTDEIAKSPEEIDTAVEEKSITVENISREKKVLPIDDCLSRFENLLDEFEKDLPIQKTGETSGEFKFSKDLDQFEKQLDYFESFFQGT